jgi:site-specific recombinase XerD
MDEGPGIRELERSFYERQEVKKSDHTVNSYRSHVGFFVDWFIDQDTKIEEIQPKTILEYRRDRFDNHRSATIRGQLNSIRVFLRFLVSEGVLPEEVPELVEVPNKKDGQRSDIVESDTANSILEYLSKYSYAAQRHVLFKLMWDGGLRTGAIRSLDVENVNLDRETISLVHRPAEDTPLKNGENSERTISIRSETADIIEDYLDTNRIDVEDEYGRSPLITTQHGRASRSWYREEVYAATRPCMRSNCPHDQDPDECDAAIRKDTASQCPTTVGPHAVRRGRITHLLRNDIPIDMISDRSDVSQTTIESNYDARTEDEKLEQRRDHLDDL